tara:strand:+ start:278 stop:1042 length:765 start_codon:yes stop_codon:yes gene_type:complete
MGRDAIPITPGLVELLHADAQRVIVRITAGQGSALQSALGEGSTAEIAEDRARQRLAQSPGRPMAVTRAPAPSPSHQPQASLTPPPAPIESAPEMVELPSAPTPAPPLAEVPVVSEPVSEPPAEPDDWSEELTAVEMELQRLGWQREQEGEFLQRAFGHPSRSRLVNYADVVSYLKALRCLEPGCSPASAPVPLRRPDLLRCSDELLGQLQWGAAQGRQLLEEQFGKASRQQLSDEQLLQFNQLLEEQLLLNHA